VKEVGNAFDAPLHRVTFAQKERASNNINKWISEKTHGKIKKSVDPSDFNSRSRPGIVDEPALVMVNTVCFKADWASRFGKEATRKRTFHIDSSTATESMMMHQRSVLLYSEDEHFKFLELPYIGGHYSMYALLPKKIAAGATMMDEVGMETVVGLKRQAMRWMCFSQSLN
jgi:serine protease inhibitor